MTLGLTADTVSAGATTKRGGDGLNCILAEVEQRI
jgi:hypothetical protein